MKTPVGIAALLLLGACGPDEPVDLPSEHGRWLVLAAERGGKATNTLDAAYFEFDTAASVLTTNMTSEELRLQYDLTEERTEMSLRGSALLDRFVVEEFTDSTLQLATTIRNTPFRFYLVPAE